MGAGAGRSRGRRAGRAAAAAIVLGLVGCPEPGAPEDAPAKPPEAAETVEFRAKAHLEAHARLLPLARRALELADPLADATILGTPPQPRPFSVGGRAALRKAVEAAWIEAADIRAEFLAPEAALLLRAARFALSRLRDGQQRRPSTRTDPAVGPAAIAALVDELIYRGPDCEGCNDALAAAAPELDAALADLGATTPARARAAAADCTAIRERLATWRGAHGKRTTTTGAQLLDEALARAEARLLAIAAALAQAAVATELGQLRAARTPTDALRLPDRLGADGLRRHLDVHEAETRPAADLFAALAVAATQLGGLIPPAKPVPALPASTPRGRRRLADAAAGARPVDAARCAAAWAPLATFAATQPVLTAAFDCGRDRLRLPAVADDDALLRALVIGGIVEPTRRATRAQTEPTLARVSGDIAPTAHRHLLSLAILSGTKQTAARTEAARAARADVCTAMVALWTHGELGDDATLRERMAAPCPGFAVGAGIDAVLARPEASLAGLGLDLLTLGPADAVALERGWWLPLGLVAPAARPGPVDADTPVAVRTEELREGGDAARDNDTGAVPP